MIHDNMNIWNSNLLLDILYSFVQKITELHQGHFLLSNKPIHLSIRFVHYDNDLRKFRLRS